MAKGRALTHFTSLQESGGGHLRSKPAAHGRREYRDVTIIKAGLGNSRDRNYYPPEMLEANVHKFDGLRAYADHPSSLDEEVQPERTVRDMVGIYSKPRFVRESKGGRIVANLNLFRSASWLSNTVDDLIDLGQADKIGLSINGRGRTVEKQLQLEEAADPINVNWVEDFMVLRSADVVTEAGAGGGFPQLLESARGSSTEETAMKRLNETQQRAIKGAVDANDMEKLTALLAECGIEAPVAAKGGKKKATPPVQEAEDDPDEDPDAEEDVDGDGDGDGTDAEEADDPDAALDAEAERIKAEADGEDLGEADEDPDADDPDAEDGEDVEEAGNPKGGAGKLTSGSGKAVGGGAGKLVGGGSNGGRMGGNAVAKTAKGPRFNQKGRRYAEGSAGELQRLKDQNSALVEKNATLSAQLRVRATTDRARNLLRESSVPEDLRPDVLRLMVGKSENEMRRVIRYHQRVIEAAVREAGGGVTDSGTRLHESHHGADGDENYSNVLDGLPLKED